MEKSWTPESWQKLTAEQQPDWENNKDYIKVLSEIKEAKGCSYSGVEYLAGFWLFGKARKEEKELESIEPIIRIFDYIA